MKYLKSFLKTFFDDIVAFANPFKAPWHKLVLPLLTLIGAWGGFPKAPAIFDKIAKDKWFQYLFLWILVMQGGASADPGLSFIAVLIFMGISMLLDRYGYLLEGIFAKKIATKKVGKKKYPGKEGYENEEDYDEEDYDEDY